MVVNLMVYCDYISNTGNSVTYAFGGLVQDITGVIKFNLPDGSFDIEKEPEKSHVSIRYIYSLFNKYRADFLKGVFKPKISYEI